MPVTTAQLNLPNRADVKTLTHIAFLIESALQHSYSYKSSPIENSIRVYQGKVKFGCVRVYCELVSPEKIELIKQLNDNSSFNGSDDALKKYYFLDAVAHYRETYLFFANNFSHLKQNIIIESDYPYLLHETPYAVYMNAPIGREKFLTELEFESLIQLQEKIQFSRSFFPEMMDVNVTWNELFVSLGMIGKFKLTCEQQK